VSHAGLDTVVVGGGPNGLAAAITLARAGRSVRLVEAETTIGGGCRTAQLTLPGFLHDVCSAVHPLARASPVFAELALEQHGVRWIEPEVQLGHPLDDGSAVLVFRSMDSTAERLASDAAAYRGLIGPFVSGWSEFVGQFLGPLRPPTSPGGAVRAMRFAWHAAQPVSLLARRFRTPGAQAMLAGCAAHSMLRLSEPISGAFALTLLASAHAVGWPSIQGGSQRLADALGACLRDAGGEIETGRRVIDVRDLPPSQAVLLDLVPRDVLRLAGDRVGNGVRGRWYARQLQRYRHGPGCFKLDLALDGPIPWRNPELLRAGTVHVGGTFEEIAASESTTRRGRVSERPFVLLAQPSLSDPTRAPAGKHTVWAYCHVPNGSNADMTDRIVRQIERFAPGFRDRILASAARTAADLGRYDANYVGGDINGGLQDLWQLFSRPALRLDPYSTPEPTLFICSSATPPGGGVHGICGHEAARSALRGVLARAEPA
jgi:phytoene dehydrogenase-like protein